MFDAVKKFMEASGQTTDHINKEQIDLYSKLINEELSEMNEAWEELDAALEYGELIRIQSCLEHLLKEINDVIWVAAGFGYSFGLPLKEGMDQVASTNLAKIIDGKVRRDPETGKVLKPEGWKPPDYHALISSITPNLAAVQPILSDFSYDQLEREARAVIKDALSRIS